MTTITYPSNYVSKQSKASFTEMCLAGLMGIVGFLGATGTGSSSSQRDIYKRAAYVIPASQATQSDTIENTAHLSISEQVKLIKDSFGLNMSAMAELLNVSRPTVYAWLKGEPPKTPDYISHVSFLVIQAYAYDELGLDRPDNFIKRPLFDEDSLFSRLKVGKTISESEFALIKKLDLKESQTRANGLKKNELRTSDDVLDDLA